MTAAALLASIALISQPPIVAETVARWDHEGVRVDAVMVNCNEQNAMYWPGMHMVIVCRELPVNTQQFVINHEMGHAWMDQHGIADSERGADELGALMSSEDEILGAAHWFKVLANDSSGDDGVHQSHMDRAKALTCLAYGLYRPTLTTAECRMYAGSLREQWQRLGFHL